MPHLYVFYVDGWLNSVSEGADNAALEENHLNSHSNNVEMLSIIAPTMDDCWLMADRFRMKAVIADTFFSCWLR